MPTPGAASAGISISPKGPKGSRLGTIDTPLDIWQKVFQVNFFGPVVIARGLIEELLQVQGRTARLRELELATLSPANQEIQQRIWALQDERTAAQGRLMHHEPPGLDP